MGVSAAPFSTLVPILKQELLNLFRHTTTSNLASRRMLLHNPNLYTPPPPPTSSNPNNTFDANVVMVLSVLLCALICSLGLNSIIRCALRCSALVATPDSPTASARLANTGIKKKALKTFPVINYAPDLKYPGLDTECAICLSDFAAGERVRVLPKCHHGFHVRCIDRWLNSHSSCPTCRHCLIHTCNKIVGSTLPLSSTPCQDLVITIQPLQREGLILNHQI
ncbi:hypothetical protein ACS0TY_029537 [Phlomoides rotata]